MPKPEDVGVGVCVVVIDSLNHFDEFLVGTRKGSHRSGHLSLPGGWIDRSDSSLEEAALRELKEEVGLVGKVADYLPYIPTTEDHEHFRTVTIYIPVEVDCESNRIVGLEPDKCEYWEWVDTESLVGRVEREKLLMFPNSLGVVVRYSDLLRELNHGW